MLWLLTAFCKTFQKNSLYSFFIFVGNFFTQRVVFPTILDMYDFCTPELQKTIESCRQSIVSEEETKLGLKV